MAMAMAMAFALTTKKRSDSSWFPGTSF
jgi:hypothetical protein